MPSSPRDPRVDPALIDSALGEEVDLLIRLIAAANASDGRLDAAALDAALFSGGTALHDDDPVIR